MIEQTACLRVCGRCLCAIVISWTAGGCVTADRALVGRYQVGDADGRCSFFSAVFAGPAIGRGRNEGRLKSDDEIRSLFGPFTLRTKARFCDMASTGIGLDEYYSMHHDLLNLALYEDTLITSKAVSDRQLVPQKDIDAYHRYLFRGNFLNANVLVHCHDHGGMETATVRAQFWRWIGYTFKDYGMDYYILDGNKNMLRKLYKSGIVTKREAVYLLARWFLERTRPEASMLEDLEYFGVITALELAQLVKLELAYLSYFEVACASRNTLLRDHAIIYNKVRKAVLWPLTIPRGSFIKAIAPSFRNVYGEAYDKTRYYNIEANRIPRSPSSYLGYDPRIAVSINDGRRLSTGEKLSRWGIGNLFSAFGAASGETQTGYVFGRRLDSSVSVFNVRLVDLARKRGVISDEKHAGYIRACLKAGLFSRHAYVSVREHDIPVLQDILGSELFLRRCFTKGFGYRDYEFLSSRGSGAVKAQSVMKEKMNASPKLVSSITVLCAKQVGIIGNVESEALLRAHFYHLLERLAFGAYLTVPMEADWRMKSQRLKVDHTVFQYRAEKALRELRSVRAKI